MGKKKEETDIFKRPVVKNFAALSLLNNSFNLILIQMKMPINNMQVETRKVSVRRIALDAKKK